MNPPFSIWCACLAVPMAVIPIVRADDASRPAVDRDQLQKWVRDLDDDRFDVRDAASQKLLKSGNEALHPLEAAVGRSPEVTHRAFSILKELTLSADDELVEATLKSLARLSASKDAEIATRAQEAARARQWQVATEFQKAGATVQVTDGKII